MTKSREVHKQYTTYYLFLGVALYQISFNLIPLQSVVERFGTPPTKIDPVVKHPWWDSSDIAPSTIASFIDSRLKRSDWGNTEFSHCWKTYTKEVDNDAYISIHPETGKIKELNFRADLREKNLVFLCDMLTLASEHNLLLMDREGNLALPSGERAVQLIHGSTANRFLSDPKKFLQEVADRANGIEKERDETDE